MFFRALFVITLFTLFSSFVLETSAAPVVEKRICRGSCRFAETDANSVVDYSATSTESFRSLIRPTDDATDSDSATAAVATEVVAASPTPVSSSLPAVEPTVVASSAPAADESPASAPIASGQILPYNAESNAALSASALRTPALALSAIAGLVLLAL